MKRRTLFLEDEVWRIVRVRGVELGVSPSTVVNSVLLTALSAPSKQTPMTDVRSIQVPGPATSYSTRPITPAPKIPAKSK